MNNIWTVRNINAHIREFFNFCLGVGYPALSCWESRTIVLFPIEVSKKNRSNDSSNAQVIIAK